MNPMPKKLAALLFAVTAIVSIRTAPVFAQEGLCSAPVAAEGAVLKDYRPIFQRCANEAGAKRLAIRSMKANGAALLFMVDPESLSTRIERAECWRCADASDAEESGTRFIAALRKPAGDTIPKVLENAGLIHGEGGGSFLTGDLCPSRKPLDRGFFEALEPRTPIALAVSGLWIQRHGPDWEWLKRKAESGALAISWVNHSFRHPYVRGRPDGQTYLLTPGVDIGREILETEKLMISGGATPSAFFRFPGLVSDEALMEKLRERHLIVLGSDSWLALGPPPRPGSIVLVHPNGNEEAGLKIFNRLVAQGKMPKPFRPIVEAPAKNDIFTQTKMP
ncbi:polysaccharide deacetylase [Methylocystis heyeri]|uniref:Polysaccharide deacetylase n=2 Tax=Methylocystis heyeri TaxID=391905 RepID=A0A6B8K9J5_9HYPH|nr:polysaccharide deacetylase [Methylocystis heyeri]